MRKLYTNKTFANNHSMPLMLFAVLLITSIFSSYSQVRVPFSPRTSNYTIKGDFTMVGNTNLTLVNYGNNTDNNNDMEYVDIDGTAVPGNNTFNSSSALVTFSTENGAIPDCSKILYAGLYWTGRSENTNSDPNLDGDNDQNTFQVTKGGITKNFDKRKVSIKGPLSTNYTEVTAGASGIISDPINIAYPTNGDQRNMYVGYADVTAYVVANGIGEYFVADIALAEGNGGGTGYYGGWGMVIVYENSKMNWRDVTVFDGHAFVNSGVASHTIDVSGFNAVPFGNVNLKLGLMAGEGDIGVSGDYFEMIIPNGNDDENDLTTLNDNSYQRLSHSGNTTGNFFNSSIGPAANTRNPNLQNNSGLDIVMFDIDNTGNVLIPNNKTYTRFRYGSTQDTYIIFNATFSVDAYIPEPEGVLNITSINGSPPSPPDILEPGQYSDYTLEIKNTGTEATSNTVITIPLPDTVNPSNLNITSNAYAPFSTTNVPYYDSNPIHGPNGAIIWDLGSLPVPANPNTVLADISFRLTVTTDCTMLSSPSFDPEVSLEGTIVGNGAISNIPFNFPLILGYQVSGLCVGEPIPTPSIIDIDYLDYINEPPTASNPAPINVECGGTVPPPDILVVTDEADNSGIAPIVAHVSDVSNGGTNPEIITRTYSVTDDCNNSINVTQTITIADTTDPDTPTLADVTGECSATATAPTTSDNCSGTITGTTTDPLTYNTQGSFVINWTFDDGNGNVISVPQNVIVDDISDPDTPTLADVTGECSATATAPTTSDNCSGTITGTTTDPLTYNTQGTFVINWTFDDGNGNVISVPQNVIVDDISDPDTPTLADVTGECSATATAPTTSDNCSGTITGTTTDPLTYNTQGTFVINWTFDDGNGNVISVPQNVIVDDISDPDTPTLADVTGECSATATAPTTLDNCSGTITGTTTDPLTYNTQGTFVINWTFDDGNGNVISVPQNVIVDDISDPDTPTLADVTGECSATATAPTTSDNCSGTITGTTTDPLTYNTQGTFVINWTFDDGNGNVISVPQNVIVDDISDPDTPTLADVTGECSATATAPTTSDNCSGTITGTTTDPLTYNTQGTFVINWTFDDGNGNVISVPQNVIVDDISDPDTPTLADVTGECSATATAPTTSDNCSGTITGTTTDPLTYNTQGTFVINWTFDDGNGNVISVPQNVIVDDISDPDTPTLADVTGQCSATATAPTTSDNCSGTITGTTTDPLTYNTQGTFVINWTFDDGNGNVISVPQNVIVDDTTDPTAPTLADLTGECSVTAVAPVITDNCNGAAITGTTTDPLTYNTQGSFVINWTFDDGNGNVISVPQNVIVDDISDPDTPTLADVTGECSATATAPTTSDNCSGTITGTTTDPLTYNTQGTFVINWTFDDGNGNVISVPQNVIVDDISDPDTPTLADVTGECSATATAPTTSDNCSGTITGTTTDPLTYNTQGSFVINWTFDDGNGNVISVPQNVIVDDISDPDTPTLADVTGECSATATAPTTSDNCSGTITGTTTDPLTYNTQGSFVINWTFDDGNGNVISVPQNVIVDDISDPDTPTLADVTGECSATATAPTTSDNCSGTITGTTTDPLTYNTQGTFVINWTFDDGNGNVISVPQNVIVDDISDPDTPTLADVTGECSATATAPTTSDNCSGTITGTTTDPLTYNTQGTFVINWTFDDGNGNVISVPQNVIVDDTTDPTAPTLADLTGECSVTAVAPVITDNCNGAAITGTTTDPLTYNTQGSFVINWTFDDGNGNVISVPQNVIVDDISDPDTPTLADVTGQCSATATAPTTSDNCSGTITGTTTDPLTYNTQGNFCYQLDL